MKINAHSHPGRSRCGSSVLVVLLLIAILFMYINATLKTLHVLGCKITLVEKHQIEHWRQVKPAGLTLTNDLPQSPR